MSIPSVPAGSPTPTPDPTPDPVESVLAQLRKAMGDTWATEAPVSADESIAIMDAVRAVLDPAMAAENARLRQERNEALERERALAMAGLKDISKAQAVTEAYTRLVGEVERIAAHLYAEAGRHTAKRLRALAATAPQTAPGGRKIDIASLAMPMSADEARAFLAAADECCGKCAPGLCYIDARNGEQFTGRVAEPSPAVPEQEREPESGDESEHPADQGPPWCTTCGGLGKVHCAAHVAGDGCDELLLTCPDCRPADQGPVRETAGGDEDHPEAVVAEVLDNPLECTCEFVDIGVGWQKAAETPDCPRCTSWGLACAVIGALHKAGWMVAEPPMGAD